MVVLVVVVVWSSSSIVTYKVYSDKAGLKVDHHYPWLIQLQAP